MQRKQTLTHKYQYWNIETEALSGERQWDLSLWDWSSLTSVGNFLLPTSAWKPKSFQRIRKVMDISLFFLFISVPVYLESFERFSKARGVQRKLRVVRISSRTP